MKLTERDRKLVQIIRENPRIQFKELGALLNISDVAARKRFLSLQKRGLLRVELIVPVAELGIVFGRLDVVTSDLEANNLLLENASKCPRIRFSAATTGEYNFSAIFSAKGMTELRSCVDHFRAWNRNEIVKDQFVMMTKVSEPESLSVPLRNDFSTPHESKSEIIRLLTQDVGQEPCGVNCSHCHQFKAGCSGCPTRIDWAGLS
ncbi:MAG: Lrp/AsnC family transcriptional regulator [Candidatus Thorarchaeota archaeon]